MIKRKLVRTFKIIRAYEWITYEFSLKTHYKMPRLQDENDYANDDFSGNFCSRKEYKGNNEIPRVKWNGFVQTYTGKLIILKK